MNHYNHPTLIKREKILFYHAHTKNYHLSQNNLEDINQQFQER